MTHAGGSEHFVRYQVQIQEALHTTNLSAYESRVLHFIIRKTFGWHITEDRISQRQIVAATGIDRRSVRRCLEQLKTRKIIHNNPKAKGGRRRTPTIGVNPNVNQWLRVGATQPPTKMGAQMPPIVGAVQPPTIEKRYLTIERATPPRLMKEARKGHPLH